MELELRFRPKKGRGWDYYPPDSIKTDNEGRFRIEAQLPGYEFRLSDNKGELPLDAAPRSGQTKALGDVRMKASNQ